MKWLPRRRGPARAMAAPAGSWQESTFAEQAWEASRGAGLRWATWGTAIGLLAGLVAFAPASWLASSVADATDRRVLLADTRGTLWSGSAVVVLTGGPESRDATSLPGRLNWSLGWRGTSFDLRATQACCLNGAVTLKVVPGFGRLRASLLAPAGAIGQWPATLLKGLGTPWNTLALDGTMRLESPGFSLESVQGRWRVDGQASLELLNVSSRMSTLDPLGSYRLSVSGDPANPGTSQISLGTTGGALQLSGNGTWGPGGVRFRGEATATDDHQAALDNLLNIIGRRSGARSVISIG